MKNIYYLIAIILTVFYPSLNAQWVQMSNGMGDLAVYALASSGNNIIAGTHSEGAYLSTDNGESWTQTLILSNHDVWAFAVNSTKVFAGSDNDVGLYSSSDNGLTWIQSSLDTPVVYSLAANGNNIFAGTEHINTGTGVYLSIDNGAGWIQTSLNDRTIRSLAVSGNNIFAGTSFSSGSYGVYLSTDNGANWNLTTLTDQTVYSLVINGNRIFAGTIGNAIYYSDDNGLTWTPTFVPGQSIYSLAVSGNNIFAGTYQFGINVSSNNGTNWASINEGLLSGISVYSICIFNNYIYIGTSGLGVWRRPLSEVTNVQTITNDVPQQFSLSQNFPNPFNPSTSIHFSVPSSEFVTLKVFDVLGDEVATLINEEKPEGTYEAVFNAANLTSGIYFYELKAGEFIQTKKMILMK
jgi:photosystem II stability/assembly factor-like uncharacterized protein